MAQRRIAVVTGTRVALSYMQSRDRGTIVQVGSALGFRGIPLPGAYCGAKHAVKGFTGSVLTELKHTGSRVRLCMVQLPGLKTPDDRLWVRLAFALIRAGRPADAEPIARSLLQTNPGNADALLLLELAQRATNSPDANATLRKFLTLAPTIRRPHRFAACSMN